MSLKKIHAVLGLLLLFLLYVRCKNIEHDNDENETKVTEIKSCTPNPCKKGTCEEKDGKAICKCRKDYHGDLCDCECRDGVCENDDKGKLICKCPPEYGLYTKTSCSKCDCGKGANCTWGGFWNTAKTCVCRKGYREVKGTCKGDCSSAPCENGGTCRAVGNDIACDCLPPYSGDYCKERECDCKGGFCEVDLNGENVCKCPPEYGVRDKNQCQKCDCGKGANCTITTPYVGITKTTCICPEGYLSTSQYGCIGDCRYGPCKNGGTCSVVGRVMECLCVPPYSGDYCEEFNPSGTRKFKSTTSRYTPLTSTPYSRTPSSSARFSTYRTELPTTRIGTSTVTTRPSTYTSYGTIFTNISASTTVVIYKTDQTSTEKVTRNTTIKMTGDDSKGTSEYRLSTTNFSTVSDSYTTRVDWCAFNPCQNGGFCANGEETYKCSCVGFYVGKNCSENTWCDKYGKDLCGKEKCQYKESVGRGYCVCENGKFFHKSSKTCMVERCTPNPCKNRGICINGEIAYECRCVDFYRGKDCSENAWCDKYGEDLCGREKCQYSDKTGRGHCVCEDGEFFSMTYKACIDYRYMLAAVFFLALLASICFCCGSSLFRMTHNFLFQDSAGYKTLPSMP